MKALHTGRIDNAVVLVNNAFKPADPLPSISQNTNACNGERARERRDEKVP